MKQKMVRVVVFILAALMLLSAVAMPVLSMF